MRRAVIAIVLAGAICATGWYCLRVGYARTLARFAVVSGNSALADHAVQLTPTDAEAQAIYGELLGQTGNYVEASDALDRAVRLRPRYYYSWLVLGQAREPTDAEGALRAMRQGAMLAPSYANARWRLGNLLLRMGRFDEAFVELRKAGSSNPSFLPNLADLAWGIYQPDVRAVTAAVRPTTDVERLTLAIVLLKYGQNTAAVEQFLLAGDEARKDTNTLLALLLQAKAFSEAYQVWAKLHGINNDSNNGLDVVHDGGFEQPLLLGETGFGWQIIPNVTNVVLSVDESNHQSGSKSLRVDFRGNSVPQTSLLAQIVRVNPGSHYRLTFATRAQQLVSAALPIVTISDASDQSSKILAQSATVRQDSPEWQTVEIDFTSGQQTRAIIIAIRRQSCADSPCPAFGTVWFDSFSLGPASPQAGASSASGGGLI